MNSIVCRDQFDDIVCADQPALLVFTAPWCRACRTLYPSLQIIAEQLKDEVVVRTVDVLVNAFAAELGVAVLPHLIMYCNGDKLDEVVGSEIHQIRRMISKVLHREIPIPVVPQRETVAINTNTASVTPSTVLSIPNGKHVLNLAQYPGGFVAPYAGPPRSSADIARELQAAILQLYIKFTAADGSEVDYLAMKASAEFADYVQMTAQLQTVDLATLSINQRKAFVLNLYNALCIHGIIVLGAPDTTVPDGLGKFFGGACYMVGGLIFSLDDIEHGILRGNQVHPATGTQCFQEGDVRAQLALECDARIHCALVCGANSCPAIRFYDEHTLDEALDAAANAYCEAETLVDADTNTITTSKVFVWYQLDFGSSTAECLRWIAGHVNETKRAQIMAIVASEPEFALVYRDYNWSPNAKV